MRFSNKTRFFIYTSVILLSSYIGYLLGNTFCVISDERSCLISVLTYVGIINLFNLIGVFILVNFDITFRPRSKNNKYYYNCYNY